jgi:hypothetical protein
VLPGRYTVTLTAAGRDYSAPLLVRLDPRVRVSAAALRAQLELLQAIDSALDAATAAHAAIARVLAGKDSLAPGVADSLNAIDGDPAGIASVAGTLASLATAVGSADAAPTQGDRAAFAEYRHRLDALLRRAARAQVLARAPR